MEIITDQLKYLMEILQTYRHELGYTIAGILVSYLGLKVVKNAFMRLKYDQRRKYAQDKAKESLDDIYSRALQHESDREKIERICSLNATELAAKLRQGELKPVEVLRCFQIQAIECHHKYNCLTEPILEAEEWAIGLESQEEKGPLYGVPVSVKESLPLKGYPDAQGCTGRLEKLFDEDCVMVQVLKALGAVPFVRTNLPQLSSSLESSQPIYGQTLNPHDPTRGPGGSSSGEAALLATQGSPLGLGSDTGGSIRCPAAMCGVTALKPSFSRVSLKGRPNDFSGNTIVMSCASPIARTVDDLTFLYKSLLSPELWNRDVDVAPLPFRDQDYHSRTPLRIGYMVYDGMCKAAPACVRAVHLAKDSLKAKGHEVIEWSPPADFGEGFWMNIESMCADGRAGVAAELQHDRVDASLADGAMILSLPLWFRKMMACCLKPINTSLYRMLNAVNGTGSTAGYWKLVRDVREYKQRIEESIKKHNLDAIICPAFGVTPLPLGSANEMLFAASYCMPFNVLDYAAGVVPVTKVTKDDITNLDNYYPASPSIYKQIKKGLEGSEGLPVSVQVAAPTWRDETCLRVMREIEGAVCPIK